MKNKKLLFVLPLFSTLALASCGTEPGPEPAKHTHTFAESFVHNDAQHWHECECGEKDGIANHVWGEGTITTSPTCAKEGVRTFTCECGATKTESVSKLDHNPDTEWQSDEENHWHNCLNQGCYEELDKAAHDFKEDVSRYVAPTCTKKGLKYLVCECGFEKTEPVEKAQHSWDEGVITTDPTCTKPGVKTFTCSECLDTKTEPVEMIEHTWVPKTSNEAYQFDAEGTWEECATCGAKRNEEETVAAPWAAFDFANSAKIINEHGDEEAYDAETHTFTTSKYNEDDGIKFDIASIVGDGRKTIDVTLTVSGSAQWGPQSSLFLLDEEEESLGSVFCLAKDPLHDAAKHQTLFNTKVFENGAEVTTLSKNGAEFTYRFDFGGFEKLPSYLVINGANGDTLNPDIICVKSIIAKETLCGHKASFIEKTNETESTCSVAGKEIYTCTHADCGVVAYEILKPLAEHNWKSTTQTAHQYDWGGTAIACTVCGKVDEEHSEYIPAPWAHADIFDETGANFEATAGSTSYDPATKTWSTTADGSNTLVINPLNDNAFKEAEGRKIITATITYNIVKGWGAGGDLYFGINHGIATSKTTRIYSAFPLQKTQGWETYDIVTDLFNAETGTDMTGINMNGIKVKYTIDVSDVETINNIWFSTSLATVTLNIEDITFKNEACNHSNVGEIHSPFDCGTFCKDCGKALGNFVNNVTLSYGSASYTDKFVYTENVTFQEKTCASIEVKENLNTSAGGWAQNYKVKLNGLLSKTKAAGKTKVSFDFYVKNSTNGDVRFYWGVGNNRDYAWADHYNPITSIAGGKVAAGSSFTQLGSKGCGDSHADGKGFYCNDWYRLTVDVSDEALHGTGIEDYFFFSAYLGASDYSTSALYITNMSVAA